MFLAESLSSPRVPNLGYMYPWGYICLSQRGTFRDVTRLDGARYKKQVWRPMFKTGLSEANALYGRKCLWHCWDFPVPPAVICPLPLLTRRPGNCALLATPLGTFIGQPHQI